MEMHIATAAGTIAANSKNYSNPPRGIRCTCETRGGLFTRSIGVCLVLATALCTSPATAAEFQVNSTLDAPDIVPGDGRCLTDDGSCTLRAATMEANALPGHDTIEVPAGIYRLTIPTDDQGTERDFEGDLELTDHTTLVGAGPSETVIDASLLGDRVLTAVGSTYPDPAEIEVVGVTMTGGTTGYGGGCVYYQGYGILTLRNSVLTGCTARSFGGGIYHYAWARKGRLVLIDSEISHNVAEGGAGISNHWGIVELYGSTVTGNLAHNDEDPRRAKSGAGVYIAGGSFTAVDSVISDNVAERRGGAIYGGQTKIFLERTTISGNTALNTTGDDGIGGAMVLDRTYLDMLNCTVSGNVAENYGGGIVSLWETHFQILFSTIAGNRNLTAAEGAGLLMPKSEFRPAPRWQVFKGTIIAENTADGVEDNCSIGSPVESLGYNVDGDGTCGLDHATDRPSLDPDLAPLAANGGPVKTHGLLIGSVAIDLVPNDQCHFSYNNDHDLKTDEDPVNDDDDDGDYRLDEDPVEIVETDGRGFSRPIGPACDAGAFEGEIEVEVEIVIENFIEEIRELIDDGEVSFGRGRSLIAELQVALWFLEFKGGERQAAVRLQIFIKKVETMIKTNQIDPALGEQLLRKARFILEMLQ
jgi:predicted outer membrane repeat protein